MEVDQLQRNFLEYTTSLFHEGFLDSQFGQLQLLQDESNPDFVVEVLTLFFEDSERLLNDLFKALDQQTTVDFKKIDAHVHQLKGSSSSIGAQRISNACVAVLLSATSATSKMLKNALDASKQLSKSTCWSRRNSKGCCRWSSRLQLLVEWLPH